MTNMSYGKTALKFILTSMFLLLEETTSERTCDIYQGYEVCYTLSDTSMTRIEAFEYCRSLTPEGGVLASVYNADIQNRLASVLENVTSPIWIAGKTEDPELLENNAVSQWRWVYDCDRCNTVIELEKHGLAAQGCYQDWAANHDLDVIMHPDSSNVTACEQACSGYAYYGLQYDQTCSCGDDFGLYGTADGCLMSCGGNCGGYGRNFIYRHRGQFSYWAYEQPDNDGRRDGVEFCVVANLADVYQPPGCGYFDEDCANRHPYICSFGGSCQTDEYNYYNTTSGTCIYVSNETEADGWHRARTACWDMGGDLVTLKNLSQHKEVFYEARLRLGDVKVYIGLYREAMVWQRVYREVEMNYYNFSDGHPNISEGSCVVLDPGDSFRWQSADCNKTYRAVCYQGPDMDPPPTTVVTETTTITTTTTKSTSTRSPDELTLVPPTSPDQSTSDTLDKAIIISLGVLLPLGVILLIVLILLLTRFCRKGEHSANAEPRSKDKVDARLRATKPDDDPLGIIDDFYLNMGSTVNLIYTPKDLEIPQKRSSAREGARVDDEFFPVPIRRVSNELILVPDFTSPDSDLENGGRYQYLRSYSMAVDGEDLEDSAASCHSPPATGEPISPHYVNEAALGNDVIQTPYPDVRYASAGLSPDQSSRGSDEPLLGHPADDPADNLTDKTADDRAGGQVDDVADNMADNQVDDPADDQADDPADDRAGGQVDDLADDPPDAPADDRTDDQADNPEVRSIDEEFPDYGRIEQERGHSSTADEASMVVPPRQRSLHHVQVRTGRNGSERQTMSFGEEFADHRTGGTRLFSGGQDMPPVV